MGGHRVPQTPHRQGPRRTLQDLGGAYYAIDSICPTRGRRRKPAPHGAPHMPAGEAPRAHVPGGSRQIGDTAEEAECEKTREERGAWRRRRETRFIWEKSIH